MPTNPPDVYYFIDPSLQSSNVGHNIYNNIQSALDHAREFCNGKHTIINLAPGNYLGEDNYEGKIRVYDNQHLIGTNGVHFRGLHCHREYTNNLVLESIIFSSRRTINFEYLKNVTFRNCVFRVSVRGCKKNCGENTGIEFKNCNKITFENCRIIYNVQKFKKFIGIKLCNTNNFMLRSCNTRILYKEVNNIEMYHFKGNKGKCSSVPYFNTFTDYIYIKEYKKHCKCAKIILFRAKHNCQPSLLATDVTIKGKKGVFGISKGDKPVYISGLVVKTNKPHHWKIGTLVNTLLTGFVSNLKGACEIKRCECIKSSCSSSSGTKCDESVSDNCNDCNKYIKKITTISCDDCSSSSSSCSSSSSSSSSCSSSSSSSSCSSGKQKCPRKNPSFSSSSSSSSCSSSSSSSDCCDSSSSSSDCSSSSSSSDCCDSSSSSSDCSSSSSSSDCCNSSSSSSDCSSSSSSSDCSSSSSSSDCSSSSSSSSSSDCNKCKY